MDKVTIKTIKTSEFRVGFCCDLLRYNSQHFNVDKIFAAVSREIQDVKSSILTCSNDVLFSPSTRVYVVSYACII